MAGLSNESWHMFEPSPIETQLALADPVKNPRAVALLPGYQADRESAQTDYQKQMDWIHQQQVAELQQKHASDMRTQIASLLQHATPGSIDAARSSSVLGPLLAGMDTTKLNTAIDAAANAKNTNEIGSGLGRLAQGNVNVQPQLSAAMPGAVQGINPMIGAAQINAASRVQAAGIHASAAGKNNGPQITYDMPVPGNMLATAHVRGAKGQPMSAEQATELMGPAPSSNPNSPVARAAGLLGKPTMPMAPVDKGTPAPQPTQPPASPTAALGQDSLARFAASNPAGAKDVAAKMQTNGGKIAHGLSGGVPVLIGASGKTYPVQ